MMICNLLDKNIKIVCSFALCDKILSDVYKEESNLDYIIYLYGSYKIDILFS